MVALTSSSRRICSLLTLSLVAALSYGHLGKAQINSVRFAGNAILCFNNKLIYSECNKEHQLDESGHLEVPCEETNLYCNGPCFSETKSLLKCINEVASNFLFNNGVTTQIVRDVLDKGCNGYITQKGTFIEGNDYNIPSRLCGLDLSGSPPENKLQCVVIPLMFAWFCLLLFQHIV